MIEELVVMLMVFASCLIFYKLGIPLFVMVTALIGFLINMVSLSLHPAIPFTPYVQLLFTIIQLTLLIKSVLKVRQ